MMTLFPRWCSASARARPIPEPPPVMKIVFPVSFITAGLRGALLLTVTAPLIEPFTFGVNVTLNVQVAPEATVDPHGVLPDGAAE